MVEQADRIKKLPPYLFARIEKKIEEKRKQGVDIISFGIGDPDKPTPDFIIDRLAEEAYNSENHTYPTSVGLLEFRKAVADYYKKRHGVSLNPENEVVSLLGSKEGIGHISFCYLNPGDVNLVPDPGYPVYGIGTLLAGGESYLMPLLEENDFIPDLDSIPQEIAEKSKLMFLNYPNNPTGALATKEFFRDVVDFAKKYDIIVCHDAAYSEIAFDGVFPISFFEVEGAKEVGIEFNSLSKPFNMTGWRIAWAIGRADVIEALGRIKSNIDSGVFQAVQYAAIEALNNPEESVKKMKEIYKERRDIVVNGLNDMGWNLEMPKGSFYVWAPVPKGYTSSEFAELVLEKAGVIVTPGNGYGKYGEGYFRISLTVEKERAQEALNRMKETIGNVEF